MKTTNIALLCVMITVLSLGTLLAADGAIPIWEPTTIMESGRYVLTRDIIAESSEPGTITITANNVDFDLNGFTIDSYQYTVLSEGDGLKIYNGTINATNEGNLQIMGDNFVVRGITFTSSDDETLRLYGNNGIVEDNLINGGGDGIQAYGDGITIRNNVIRNAESGIELTGQGNQVLRNTISSCQQGIVLSSSLNLIEGNLLTDNSNFGLRLYSGSENNVYRGNTVRGNTGDPLNCSSPSATTDFCDDGTNNTSHGDNYMPGQM